MSTPLDDAALDQLFRSARTFNHYRDEPVGEDTLRAIWDLMKMGPTSANQLPARLVWCVSDEAKATLAAACSDTNKTKVLEAPVSVVVGMDVEFHEHLPELFPHTDAKSWFEGDEDARVASAKRNATLQGAYLLIAARAVGLDCGPMSGVDLDKITEHFFADSPRHRADWVCGIGYGDADSLFDRSPRPDFDKFTKIV